MSSRSKESYRTSITRGLSVTGSVVSRKGGFKRQPPTGWANWAHSFRLKTSVFLSLIQYCHLESNLGILLLGIYPKEIFKDIHRDQSTGSFYNSKIFGNFLYVPQREIVKYIVYVQVMHYYLQQLEIRWKRPFNCHDK